MNDLTKCPHCDGELKIDERLEPTENQLVVLREFLAVNKGEQYPMVELCSLNGITFNRRNVQRMGLTLRELGWSPKQVYGGESYARVWYHKTYIRGSNAFD